MSFDKYCQKAQYNASLRFLAMLLLLNVIASAKKHTLYDRLMYICSLSLPILRCQAQPRPYQKPELQKRMLGPQRQLLKNCYRRKAVIIIEFKTFYVSNIKTTQQRSSYVFVKKCIQSNLVSMHRMDNVNLLYFPDSIEITSLPGLSL